MSAMRIAAVAVTMLVSAAIGFGSRAPYSPPGSDSSTLRLSWRLRGERKEECRARTPEELAALPVHMRSPQVCSGYLVKYRMTLRIDDAPPLVEEFAPAGAKGDRPIFVMFVHALTPGAHEIDVTFTPMTDAAVPDDDDVTSLTFHSRVQAAPGQIVLITLSEDATTLIQKR